MTGNAAGDPAQCPAVTSLLHPGRRALVVGLTVVAAVSVLAASTVGPAGAAGTPVGRPPAAVPARPNILFVLTDDMTVADLGSMPGVRRVITDHGLRFTRAMVSVSLCCPSRTTILRGQYAHNTGVLTNGGTNGGVEAAYRSLKAQGKVTEDIRFIAFGGDGGTYDIGLQSLSGAMERRHRML
ncbi:MAG: sulfatase-like hydrolase/transferase, partial [Acidimicrobiia bacterium]